MAVPRRDRFCFGESLYSGNGVTRSLSIFCWTSLLRPYFLKRWISAALQHYKWGHGSHPEAAISSGSEIRASHAQEIEEATHKGVCRQTLYGTPASAWLDQIIHFWGCCEWFTANRILELIITTKGRGTFHMARGSCCSRIFASKIEAVIRRCKVWCSLYCLLLQRCLLCFTLLLVAHSGPCSWLKRLLKLLRQRSLLLWSWDKTVPFSPTDISPPVPRRKARLKHHFF